MHAWLPPVLVSLLDPGFSWRLPFKFQLFLLAGSYLTCLPLFLSPPTPLSSKVPRPYRIPLNLFACVLFIIPPVALTIFVMMLASYLTYICGFISLLIGVLLFNIQESSEEEGRQRWCGGNRFYKKYPNIADFEEVSSEAGRIEMETEAMTTTRNLV